MSIKLGYQIPNFSYGTGVERLTRSPGPDLPDAWLAAAVTQTGEHLVSFDRDFRKLLGRSQFSLLVPA